MTTPSSGGNAPIESQGPATGVAAVTAGSAFFVWCAEAPDYPGYYALKEPRNIGKLGELGKELGTPNIHEALHFKTRAECEAWINGNHLWKATEHGLCIKMTVRPNTAICHGRAQP